MGSLWLRDLPAALDGVRNVGWYDGWENRSRSSGGYDALYAIGVHHTASSASPTNDMAYMWRNATDKPIGAIYLARDGAITVGAAGATNTQGKGGPYTTSKGTIPLDAGNRYMLSIEAANNGVGERWPDPQLDAYLALCAALCGHYRLDPTRDIVAHFEWTTRKVDPAGPVRYATAANSWNMPAFRDDVHHTSTPPTPQPPDPAPTPPGDDMIPLATRAYDSRDDPRGPFTISGEGRTIPIPLATPGRPVMICLTAISLNAQAGFFTVSWEGHPYGTANVQIIPGQLNDNTAYVNTNPAGAIDVYLGGDPQHQPAADLIIDVQGV